MSQKILTIIPVRLASTRLPNKPLADICGKTMIERVYQNAIAADIGDVLIACDGLEIADEVERFGGKYVITNPDLKSGTDRIYQAFEKFGFGDYDVIVNLQGDLPEIDPKLIKAAADCLIDNDCDVATIASMTNDPEEYNDPNVVKIAISFKEEGQGRALYFSRSPIPHSKDVGYFYHHIGIYAYKKSSLQNFVNLQQSDLEKKESLEQLRALENDMSIFVKIVDSHPVSVDTPDDLEKVKKIINEKG